RRCSPCSSSPSLHDALPILGIEVWLPVQDISYYEEYKDTVDFNETPWFENGKVGLVVPEYIENINSVEDLNDHKELFEGENIGLDRKSTRLNSSHVSISYAV